jgi:signal transduction histidine kinase
MEHHIAFAPEILARLGEELVPHADLGIMELVRNAYDADAKLCRIELAHASEPGGTLVISDNGVGMSEEQLASGFLLIGKSEKAASTETLSGRRKIGEKGLGRLAALRLGSFVQIETRPEAEPSVAYVLEIDWPLFDAAVAVEDVPLTIRRQHTAEPPGTTIRMTNLHKGLNEKEIDELFHALLMLTGPFQDFNNFRIECDAPEFDRLAEIVHEDWFGYAEFRLVATLDKDGQASAVLYNRRGEPEYQGGHKEVALRRTRGRKGEVPGRFVAPPASLELWIFNLNPAMSHELRHAQQPTDHLKRWLPEVGGIHLYHRGLRVQPYGDRGNDWLGMNLRRAASPEVRPSTNNSLGRIITQDEKQLLRPKTDRSGFINSPEFSDLQEFAKRALDWAATQRMGKREDQKLERRVKARSRAQDSESKLRRLVDALNINDPNLIAIDDIGGQESLSVLAEASLEAIEASREEAAELLQDLRLYRSLASVGTSTAVFAHESLRPTSLIITVVKELQELISQEVEPEIYSQRYKDPLEVAGQSAETVATFAKLPLSMLEKAKREPGLVSIDDACRTAVHMYTNFLTARGIAVQLHLEAPDAKAATTIADMESILGNLLVNAAHALIREDAPPRTRVIRISTGVEEKSVRIAVDDTGPGIVDMPLREIWLPGRTGRDNGTGLGLTIVRDIVADLNGRHMAYPQGELGGARIAVWIPVTTAHSSDQDGEGEMT